MSTDPLAWLTAAAAQAPAPVAIRRSIGERTGDGSKWAWTNDANCRHADPDIFYPEHAEPYPPEILDTARAICGTCPAFAACHAYALDHETEGIWAATTPRQRRRIRRARGLPDLGRLHPVGPDEDAGLTPPPLGAGREPLGP